MFIHKLLGGSTAAIIAAGALMASAASTQAAMLPSPIAAPSYIQHVDCAVGAHIGPLGACILGTDNPPTVVTTPAPVIVEQRAADVPVTPNPDGCSTKSVNKTDGMGNSVTKTQTNC